MPWRRTITPDPVILFRYSALTFNPHRIHYDRPYAMETEGYPGLVVHGPFSQQCLLDLLRDNAGGRTIRSFSMRARAPLFDVAPFTVIGRPTTRRRGTLGGDAAGDDRDAGAGRAGVGRSLFRRSLSSSVISASAMVSPDPSACRITGLNSISRTRPRWSTAASEMRAMSAASGAMSTARAPRKPSSSRADRRPRTIRAAVRFRDRRGAVHHVAEQLDRGAAEPDHHHGAERVVVDRPDDDLISLRRHTLHQHALDGGTRTVASGGGDDLAIRRTARRSRR